MKKITTCSPEQHTHTAFKRKCASVFATFLLLVFTLVKVQAQACNSCPGTIYTTVNSNTLGILLTNQKFCITTSLIINQDLTLDACNIYMSPGSVIEILPGNKLTITNKTYITSCGGTGNMWAGIHVGSISNSPYGKIEVNGGSIIEDAVNAIYTEKIDQIGEVILTDAYFNRNYRDVYIHREDPIQTTNRYNIIGSIEKCHFICKTAWNSSTDAQLHQPWNGRTRVNIEFDCVQLGGTPTPYLIKDNFFDNANKAIYSYYSFTKVEGNSFNNHDVGIEAQFDGALIAIGNYNFTNVNNCISVHDLVEQGVYIVGNKIIDNCWRGITVRNNCLGGQLNISNNEINNCSNYAIRVFNNPSWPGKDYIIKINDNIITNNQNGFTMGIITEEKPGFIPTPPPNHAAQFEINRNVLTGHGIGIRAINGYSVDIMDNTIGINNTGNSFGISVINSIKPTIKNNSVLGQTLNPNCEPQPVTTTGIRVNNSTDALVMCNSVDQLDRGVEYRGFTGNITASAFYENTLGFCNYQLYLLNVPYGIGDIGNASFVANNSWTGNNCTSGNYLNTMANASNLQNVSGATKIYENAAVPVFNDIANSGGYCQFITTNVVTEGYCNRTPPDDLIALINKLQSDSIYDANYRYWQNEYLMQRAREDGTLTDSIIALQDLIDSLAQTNLGYIAMINDSTRNYVLDSMTNTTLATLQVLNNQVQPDLLLETNYKVVNQIYFYALTNGINALSTYSTNVLTNIAMQCPLSGGKAVYLARFLLDMATDSIVDYADDCNNYLPVMRYKNGNTTLKNTAQVYIAENKINCRFDYATATPAIFSIYNTLGICIAQYAINKNTDAAFFDVPNVNGVCFYKITGLVSGDLSGKFLSVKK